MGLVADRAPLSDRRMLEGERPLLLRMTLVADQIDRFLLEVPQVLAVWIMAIGANHFAFLDGMMRGKCIQSIYFRMAFVTCFGLLHRHRHPFRASDLGVADIHDLRDAGVGMGIMAIGASYTVVVVY